MTEKNEFLNENGRFSVIGITFDDVFQRIIVDSTQLYLCLYVLSDDFDQNNPKISQKFYYAIVPVSKKAGIGSISGRRNKGGPLTRERTTL